MKYVVVDFEMNKVSKSFDEKRHVWNMEIIEIGAVVLDEEYKEILCFKTYVKPSFNSIIDPKIERLTGITTGKVMNAPKFEEAFHMFVEFCRSINDEIMMVQWSENDLRQILGEIAQKDYQLSDNEKDIVQNWYDFQHEFGEILGLSKQVSLENALRYAGVDFVGDMHDALYDARNTAELFTITRVEEKKQKTLDKVVKMLHPEERKCTIGDIFDFSQIMTAFC